MGFVSNYTRNLFSLAAGQEPVRPLLFSFYVTHRCNLACCYCCDGDGKRFKQDPVDELSTPQTRKLLSALREVADTLDVTGGEPMLRDDLEGILAYARRIGFRTVLNTKGVGLQERPDILRFTSVLVLSLDTLDAEELAALMGRPIRIARRVLDALHFALGKAPETRTRVVLSSVATPDNLDAVSRVLRFAAANALGFHLSPEIVGTRVNPRLRGNQQYQALIEEVLAAKNQHVGVLGIRQYLDGIGAFARFRCHPLLMPVIRPDGRLYYPCLEAKRAEISILEAGSYWAAVDAARRRYGELPKCDDCCHIFCHMALSLLQRHPLSALAELRHLRGNPTRR